MLTKFIGKYINTDDKRRLASSFISLSVLRGFQFLIPLITLPYLVKTIGIENYGRVNFALSLSVYCSAIIQYGFGITATREIARNRSNLIKLQKIYSATISASVILTLVSVILFSLIVFSFQEFSNQLSLYYFTLMYVVFQSLFPIWFFQGVERMKYITFLSLGTSVMYLLSLIILVTNKQDYVLVPLLHANAAFVTYIISIIIIKRQFRVKYELPTFAELKQVFKEGFNAFISQLAPNMYNNSSVFLLGIFANNTVVGFFSASAKLIDAIISLAHILSNTFLPYLSRSLENHVFFQRVMIGVGATLTGLTFITAEWLTELLFSAENSEVSIYIRGLAVSVISTFIFLTYGPNYLMLIGKDKIVRNIAVYTSLAFFAIALIIIPLWGIWGAIVTLSGARTAMGILQYIFFKKYRGKGQIL